MLILQKTDFINTYFTPEGKYNFLNISFANEKIVLNTLKREYCIIGKFDMQGEL